MRFSSLLANAAAGLAMTQEKYGSEEPGAEAYQTAVSLRTAQRAEGLSTQFLAKRAEGLLIMTYLHVVEDAAHRRFVTDKIIDDQEQIRVLNETFAPHNIQFVVRDVTHTVNDAWTVQARIKEKAEALHQGAYDDLNIFETGLMKPNSVTGLCSFPVEDPWNTGINGTSRYTYDGCHVSVDTMPDGPGVPWGVGDNLGKTATHEGFDCDGEGDLIDDTPPTKVATVGCPLAQDSCPEHPGLDSVYNSMDYTRHAWEDCDFSSTHLMGIDDSLTRNSLSEFTTL
ncbi:uncharacterized protein LY79DRAFT_691847 [Colletotrichum navitas]|uniref:Metalloprotease 1 n=1 Tax=Colletotrichum navitas TaxID=681940 RepID=A0AAD8V2F1_9PEZI|nr:uncharacterized protein LY79DRAFT_691847 [Colletotrichum navitas]KAK1580732.1 hypothetical protein LY79DRAFT_691847 [Colletotrichum navitas]